MAHEHTAGGAMITADADHSAHLRLVATPSPSTEIRYLCLSSRSRVRPALRLVYRGIAHLMRPVPNS
jgi:hypothetical protein